MKATAPGAAWVRSLVIFWQKTNTDRLLKPVAVTAVAYLILLALFPLLLGYTSPLDFAHLGYHFCQCPAKAAIGYDGQFYYYMAVDPVHASSHMDSAPYRYQRIFYPLAVWALSLGGQASLAAWWLLLLNVLGALAGTAALAVLLQRRGLSPWFSLIFGLYFGQFAAITHDVPDGLAASFVVFAALAADREHWKTCAFWLAIAGLTRETTLLFAAGAALNALFQKRPGRAGLLLSAAVPEALWLVALRLIFGKTGLSFSGAKVASSTPFAGFASIPVGSPRFLITLVVLIIPAVVALIWIAREVARRTWKAAPGWLFVTLVSAGLVIFLNNLVYDDLASSSRVTISLSLGWLLYASARGERVLLWLASPWALSAALYALAVVTHLQSIIV
jgi:hypothetical protein